jgi:hypothetical protein
MKDLSIHVRNVDDMKVNTGMVLVLVCIAAIVCAGCTGSAPAGTPATASPTITEVPPTTIAENVTVTVPAQESTNATKKQNTTETVKVSSTITAKNADPILHRYVFRWPDLVKNNNYGYEYKFYQDGTVIYKYGIVTEVSSNLKINPTTQMVGTWTNLGNNTYLVKILPEGKSGQYYTREYTLVPDYVDPLYPGIVNREHIESDYERDAIFPGYEKTDRMYFPERAKID